MRALQHNEAPARAEAFSCWPVAWTRLLGCCRCHCAVGFGVLAAEALDAARRVHQTLFAGKERVANRTDFHVNVALVGRTGLKVVSAGALDMHRVVFGMNLFLWHL